MDHVDELLHRPGGSDHWSESYYFDFVDDEVAGHVRVESKPNAGDADVWTYIHDGDRWLWSHDTPSAAKAHGGHVDAGGWTVTARPLELGERWSVDIEGILLENIRPEDLLREDGNGVEVEASLTFDAASPAFYYSSGEDWIPREATDRYEQACRVSGDVRIEGESLSFMDAPGERDHSWGRRKWSEVEHTWSSAGFEDDESYNLFAMEAFGELLVNGFWFDGDEPHAITDVDLRPSREVDAAAVEDWAGGDPPSFGADLSFADDETRSLSIEPVLTTPVALEDDGGRCILARSPCTVKRADGVTGAGYTECNRVVD